MPVLDPMDRFTVKVVWAGPDDCWLWTAAADPFGYGRFRLTREHRTVVAHRWYYEQVIGPIPAGLQLDHLCRVPACVNPAHLEPVTQAENIRRGVGASAMNARKTECAHGHPYDADNTRVRSNGRRVCITCDRERDRRRVRIDGRLMRPGAYKTFLRSLTSEVTPSQS